MLQDMKEDSAFEKLKDGQCGREGGRDETRNRNEPHIQRALEVLVLFLIATRSFKHCDNGGGDITITILHNRKLNLRYLAQGLTTVKWYSQDPDLYDAFSFIFS